MFDWKDDCTWVDGERGSIGSKLSLCGKYMAIIIDDGSTESSIWLDADAAEYLLENLTTVKGIQK